MIVESFMMLRVPNSNLQILKEERINPASIDHYVVQDQMLYYDLKEQNQ